MKVCTDACLFGALVADRFQHENVGRVLDIGAGTGLLSLMVAQKISCEIDAVEIDENAYEQASENFSASPWSARLHVHHQAIQDFDPPVKYDLVISNPPFYERDLRSPDEQRNVALHGTRLGFDDLLQSVKRLLSDDGSAAFLVPYERENAFEEAMLKNEISVWQKVLVRQSVNHHFFRVIYLVKKRMNEMLTYEEMAIKDVSNRYTGEFNRLLNDYYL